MLWCIHSVVAWFSADDGCSCCLMLLLHSNSILSLALRLQTRVCADHLVACRQSQKLPAIAHIPLHSITLTLTLTLKPPPNSMESEDSKKYLETYIQALEKIGSAPFANTARRCGLTGTFLLHFSSLSSLVYFLSLVSCLASLLFLLGTFGSL